MKRLIKELNRNMVLSAIFEPVDMVYTIITTDENDNKKTHYIDENGKEVKKK